MSFFSKIVENNKNLAIGIGVAAAVAIGVGILYKEFSDAQQKQKEMHLDQEGGEEPNKQQFDLEAQIEKLKAQINMYDPSADDIKAVLTFSVEFTKKKILAYSKQFKKARRMFNKTTRREKMNEYLSVVVKGMEEVQNIGLTLQQEILTKVGITEMHIMKHQMELAGFMQELMSGGMNAINPGDQKMTLEEVKNCIQVQIEYLKQEGIGLIDDILHAVQNWGPQKKALIPTLLAVIVADEAFEDRPEIDEQQLQSAQMQFQNYLVKELRELQGVMAPLMQKLQSMMPQQQMFPGMGGGMTPEQLQQLKALQAQDPAAFEEMMRMMQGSY